MPKTSLYSNPISPLATVDSIVTLISVENKLDPKAEAALLHLARRAIIEGSLPSHNAQTTAHVPAALATPLVTIQEFNDWAKNSGVTLKLPTTKPRRTRKKPVVQTGNWKHRIQTEATRHILALRKHGSNPTVQSIIPDIRNWCIQNDVMTPGRIIPSHGYIRTHVLGGRYWTPPP